MTFKKRLLRAALEDELPDWWPTDNVKMKVVEAPKKVAVAPTPVVTPKTNEPIAIPRGLKSKEITSEEKEVLRKYGDYPFYTEAGASPEGMRHWMQVKWAEVNRTEFSGKLKPCNLLTLKDQGTKFKLRGVWKGGYKRELALSPRLFNSPEEITLVILIHEMCHQAVTDIDKTVETREKGHGPLWQHHMLACGLTPSRYDHYDNDTYSDDAEIQKKDEFLKDAFNRNLDYDNIKSGDIVEIKDTKKMKTYVGVVIRRFIDAKQQRDACSILIDGFKGTVVHYWTEYVKPFTGDKKKYQGPVWTAAYQKACQKYGF